MSRRTRAWQLVVGVTLIMGCSKPNERDPPPEKTCSTQTACPAGYKCEYDDASGHYAVGHCEYEVCGQTEPCKEPKTCLPGKETAMCDKMNNDKFCECVGPNSQDVPSTPTTSAGQP